MQTAMGKTLELGFGEGPNVMSVLSAYDNLKYPRIGVKASPNKVSSTGIWEPALQVQHLRLRRFSALIKVNEERSTFIETGICLMWQLLSRSLDRHPPFFLSGPHTAAVDPLSIRQPSTSHPRPQVPNGEESMETCPNYLRFQKINQCVFKVPTGLG